MSKEKTDATLSAIITAMVLKSFSKVSTLLSHLLFFHEDSKTHHQILYVRHGTQTVSGLKVGFSFTLIAGETPKLIVKFML